MLVPLIAGLTLLSAPEPFADVRLAFDQPLKPEQAEVASGGPAGRRATGPKVEDGRLTLLEPRAKFWAVAAFPTPSPRLARVVEAEWTMSMSVGSDGMGFVWLPEGSPAVDVLSKVESWDAPSVPGAFSVSFDPSNPRTRDPFSGSGNIHDRPEHEASIHWNGREIFKLTTPIDFRDEKPHRVAVRLEHVPGGAEATLSLDGKPFLNRYFVAGLHPYVGRPAFGAGSSTTGGEIYLDDVRFRLSEPTTPAEPPLTVVGMDRVLNDKDHHRNVAEVEFPADTSAYSRIVATLKLEETPAGIDAWDRLASIRLLDEKDQEWELIRYITPYRKGWEWKMDLTDLRPLLTGKKRLVQWCETYGEGWLVSVKFDYYRGPTDRVAYRVERLWYGAPEIGNPDKPASAFYVPKTVKLDRETVAAKFRMVVTGHGMFPNTDNAGEFMPLGRTVTLNGKRTKNLLWKTDNYLNPVRPQGGTWKYDRAGWAPGDVVRPWEVDAGKVRPGGTVKVEYALDKYVNLGRGKTWAPFHQTDAVLVLYRDAKG